MIFTGWNMPTVVRSNRQFERLYPAQSTPQEDV
jgi:hypothetical protein